MKMKSFAGLDVKIEDGEVILTQSKSYSTSTIQFPIEMWEMICAMIDHEVLIVQEES